MVILLTTIHIIVCLFLVIVVLLQSGKAADLAGAFGGMGSQTAFGPRGSATVLSKATTVAAALFMVTSLTLSIMATRGTGGGTSVLEAGSAPVEEGAPASTPASSGQPVPVDPSQATDTPGEGPAVTLTDPETGEQKTVPLNLPPPPEGGQESPNN